MKHSVNNTEWTQHLYIKSKETLYDFILSYLTTEYDNVTIMFNTLYLNVSQQNMHRELISTYIQLLEQVYCQNV